MLIKQIPLQELMAKIATDNTESRFVARVFFVNSLKTYYTLIDALTDKSDIVVRISDDLFCKGEDTVPDIKALIDYLDMHKDNNALVPHLGEYLRIGEATERNAACLYSLLNRHVHSNKRVWIPIFSAEGLFQSIVGKLDEERFGDALFKVDEAPTDFSALAYSKPFANQPGIVNANGLKAWLRLWVDKKIESGMSYATRQIKQLSPSSGDYALSVITDPFSFICSSLKDNNAKLIKELGTTEQWTSLVPYAAESSGTLEHLITSSLNIVKFDPYQILRNWTTLDSCKQWIFFLWYKLGLNQQSNYISYAMSKAETVSMVSEAIECAIVTCTENTNLDEWLAQRKQALDALGIKKFSQEFWTEYDKLTDTRLKIKVLTGKTHEERTKIIELVSQALSEGKQFSNFKTLLKGKYADLILYLSEPMHLDAELAEYIYQYKANKLANRFNTSLSNMAGDINQYEYKTRGQILYSLKGSSDAYFVWIDGMGIEWIDMLLEKVKLLNPVLVSQSVDIGTAVLPTITQINMEKADPDTISEKKFDALDSLSHIKDKSDCNYYSIIASQFEMMDRIAELICQSAKNHPDRDIVVTADHGMSRLAALGFHKTGGIDAPASATVQNHGRYCEIPAGCHMPLVSNTIKGENVIAFNTHNHFSISGNAPGEVHGGASPEEILVPIIRFKKLGKKQKKADAATSYSLTSSDVYLDSNGDVTLYINTQGLVKNVTLEINGNQLQANEAGSEKWKVLISGLILDQIYSVRIYLNNIYSTVAETIHVKRKGLIIDDDI